MSEQADIEAALARATAAYKNVRAERDALKDANDRAEAAEAENDRLREALEFYANPEIYEPHPHGIGFDRRDKSYVARAALAKEAGQ